MEEWRNGEIWSSALMKIWGDLGRDITDQLFLETHFIWGQSPNMRDAAAAFIQADINLYNGIHLCTIMARFNEHGLTTPVDNITTNTTWITPMQAPDNIWVRNGATLTIKSTVYCEDYTFIVVEPGGKLVIDGGTLTRACGTGMWRGVAVYGDPTSPLTQPYQGLVDVKNGGTIQYAEWGIRSIKGGMVKATDAHFINNQTGVRFEPIALGQSGTSGIFTRTNFDTDYHGFYLIHLQMESSGQVNVTDCSFSSILNNSDKITISNTSTNWAGDNYLERASITVQSGGIFTNTSIIRSDANTDIVVLPGGKLIADGGMFTNLTSGEMWQGIIVWGTGSSSSMVQILNGGTVENAICGIEARDGGRVQTIYANFINNRVGVFLDQVSRGSSFLVSNFIINDNYLENPAYFTAHLKVINNNSRTVEAMDCTFLNENSLTTTNTTGNIGIWTFNPNSFYVEGSIFSGFHTAIFASNSGAARSLSAIANQFSDNLYGIRLNALDYALTYSNNFTLSFPNSIGLYYNQSTGYYITQNKFSGTNQSLQTTGMLIEKSGEEENIISENHFFDLHTGIQAIDKNSSQNNPIMVTGLQFQCNYFSDTQQRDILVGDSPSTPSANHSVRRNQGEPLFPTGNTFIGTFRPNITNYSNYPIKYYFPQMGTPPVTVGSVSSISSGRSMCSGRSDKSELSLSQYDEWNKEYEYWLSKLAATEVGKKEYDIRLNNVSYYSALKDNYFNAMIVEVCGERHEVSGEEKREYNGDRLYETLRYLFAYRNHYTDNLSIAETYLAESKYKEALTALDKMYKQFKITEEQNAELKGLQTYIHWLQQLEEKGNSIYKLSEGEIGYLVKFVATNTGRGTVFANNILCVLYDICIEDETIKRLDDEAIRGLGDEMIRRLDDEDMNNTSHSSPLTSFDEQGNLDNITLIPNPTTGKLQVTCHASCVTNIEVFDIYGRKLLSHTTYRTPHTVFDISHLTAGIYFVKISTEAGEVVKKVIKN
jgi:hypothetical protein